MSSCVLEGTEGSSFEEKRLGGSSLGPLLYRSWVPEMLLQDL